MGGGGEGFDCTCGFGAGGLIVDSRSLNEDSEAVRAKGKKGGEFGAAVRSGEGGWGWYVGVEGVRSVSS